jgi:pimeloyl-ACP methyl ester carboxylesterase
MAKARRDAPAPVAADAWTVETPVTAPDVRVRFVATYPAPEFRKPKPDGKWELDASGAPVSQKVENLETFLAFSDSTKGGPRPVVIFGHGLGGDKDGCWGTAERLAQIHPQGVAVFAIDSPEHGSRGDGSSNLIQSVYGFFGIDPNSTDFDIARARDNFRQMAADQLELVRFIGALGTLDLLPVGAPDGQPDLDVSRILYIGHSFGAVQGPTIFALAPEITQANWNVGGAGLMMLLRDSGTFSLVVKSLAPPGTSFGAVARFMAMTQAIVDPGDPLNFARYATLEPLEGVFGWAARDVLLQEVVDDTIVPNSTTEALARAAGLEVLNPVQPPSGTNEVSAPVSGNLATGGTGVICQFDTINGGKNAVHGDLIFSPEGQAQYVEFFKTGLAAAHATVPAPY